MCLKIEALARNLPPGIFDAFHWDTFASYCSKCFPASVRCIIMTFFWLNILFIWWVLCKWKSWLGPYQLYYIGGVMCSKNANALFKVSLHAFLFGVSSWLFFFQVRDVRLIMDRNSRRSKGVGYVYFKLCFLCCYKCWSFRDAIFYCFVESINWSFSHKF